MTTVYDLFWISLENQWHIIYEAISNGSDEDRQRVLQLLHYFAGDISEFLDFEITLGEINRIVFEIDKIPTNHIVELYISPKLSKDNIEHMEQLYNARRPIKSLHTFKYRSYNAKDPMIARIDYPEVTYEYNDFGCQTFNSIDENKKPIVNIVLYVKNPAAKTLLKQKEITFIETGKATDNKAGDGKAVEKKIVKWLPTESNVVDVLLLNIIGEYNLIHRTGYIEFIPEGSDCSEAVVFTELADLKPAYVALDKLGRIRCCTTCTRKDYQCKLLRCSKCRNVYYCSEVCQALDFKVHRRICSTHNTC